MARPQDPELEWSRTHNPPAVRSFTEPPPWLTQKYEHSPGTRKGAYFDQMFPGEVWDTAVTETDSVTNKQQLSVANVKVTGIQLPKMRRKHFLA